MNQSANINEQLIACETCGHVYSVGPLRHGFAAECEDCGSTLASKTLGSMHLTAAFALSALLLYIPANIFPIVQMNLYGSVSENTVWQGCVRLYQDGDYIIALVVFLASILLPFLKLAGLFYLSISVRMRSKKSVNFRTKIYKITEVLGRWAMLDVFVIAVLVALVKLGRLANVVPGSGLLAFTGVVIFTLLASASFDPELIWNTETEL
jgi:paraquat-inducible protein A